MEVFVGSPLDWWCSAGLIRQVVKKVTEAGKGPVFHQYGLFYTKFILKIHFLKSHQMFKRIKLDIYKLQYDTHCTNTMSNKLRNASQGHCAEHSLPY